MAAKATPVEQLRLAPERGRAAKRRSVDIIPMLKHTLEDMTFAAALAQGFRDPATINADDL